VQLKKASGKMEEEMMAGRKEREALKCKVRGTQIPPIWR
jgi:hypothetical protein